MSGVYYDRMGSPITMEWHGELHEDPEYVIVAKRRFEGNVEVSTCWLGIDHNLFDDDLPGLPG